MGRLRHRLTCAESRGVALALAVLVFLPALADLHVLAAGHRNVAHGVLLGGHGEPPPSAPACDHGGARHLEAAGVDERAPCAACLQRTTIGLAASVDATAGTRTCVERAATPLPRSAPAIALAPPSSRGPPRA
jgi:hypothetical protein